MDKIPVSTVFQQDFLAEIMPVESSPFGRFAPRSHRGRVQHLDGRPVIRQFVNIYSLFPDELPRWRGWCAFCGMSIIHSGIPDRRGVLGPRERHCRQQCPSKDFRTIIVVAPAEWARLRREGLFVTGQRKQGKT